MKRGRRPEAETIDGVLIEVRDVAECVYEYGQYLKRNFDRADLSEDGDCSTSGGDMRLQVHDGGWATWEGDSQYDTDHRGAWGFCFVPWGCSRKVAREIARDLLRDVEPVGDDDDMEGDDR